MATARKRIPAVRKVLVRFSGGPFDGKMARISKEAARITAQFTASGMTGHYENGHWRSA